jgi:hypothetical protein
MQTAAALWQQHLDRSVAYRSNDSSQLDVQPNQAARKDRPPEDQQRWPHPPARPNSPPAARL